MKTIILKTFFAVAIVATLIVSHVQAAEWFKGQLHAHSMWSDGNTLPELAVAWHKDNGYHFFSLTDHNVLQFQPDRWIEVTDRIRIGGGGVAGPGNIGQEIPQYLVDEARARFGDDWVDMRMEGERKLIRLKTLAELAEQFNEEGTFLLIPGHEQNIGIPNQPSLPDQTIAVTLHANAINITESIPFPRDFPTVAAASLNWRQATMDNASANGLEGFWMLCHPTWPYYDVLPEVLIEGHEIEFFEFRNVAAGPAREYPDMPSMEQYWDIVNSFRISNGHTPIYGVITDDTHHWRDFRDNTSNPSRGWIFVRAEKLNACVLIRAMNQGDFYGTTGVVLKDVRFDPEARTLTVEVEPAEGVEYTIRFVGTKRGFDTTRRPVDLPEVGSSSARRGWAYSDDIGATFQTTVGNSATYTMTSDDLYVRAIITSNRRMPFRSVNAPEYESAWTQPVGW